MATKGGGKYVVLSVNVWYDKTGDNIHVTSNDSDIPGSGLHMTAKKGTASDKNLRALLESFGLQASKNGNMFTALQDIGEIMNSGVLGADGLKLLKAFVEERLEQTASA